MQTFIKKTFLLILLSFVITSFAQNKQEKIKKIDSLIIVADKVYVSMQPTLDLLKVTGEILNLSKQADYDKGFVYANFYIATSYLMVNKHDESVNYLQKNLKYKDYLETNLMQYARNHALMAENYRLLHLNDMAEKYYNKGINTVNKIENKSDKDILVRNSFYLGLGIMYNDMNQKDSARFYFQTARENLEKIKSTDIVLQKAIVHYCLGKYYLGINNDSALYHHENALQLLKGKNNYYEGVTWFGIGEVYRDRKDYKKAIDAFKKSFEMYEQFDDKVSQGEINQKISEIYAQMGDEKKSIEYSKEYFRLNQLTQNDKNKNRDAIVKRIIELEKESQKTVDQKKLIIISGIALIAFVLILGFFYFYKNKKGKLVDEQQNIIEAKEKENQQLQNRVNESFDEIIELAKTNSPLFFARFQEIYPEFGEKLLSINSKLSTAELTLAAYFYLGFATKDIAENTFRTLKTVENTRYNLRKKLLLDPKENLVIWLKNM